MAELEMLSVMALIEELPERGLQRGQIGTIVESRAPGVYEVEFSDDPGRTYASAAIPSTRLMRLYHEPKHHIHEARRPGGNWTKRPEESGRGRVDSTLESASLAALSLEIRRPHPRIAELAIQQAVLF